MSSSPEQFLEWTHQHRIGGTEAVLYLFISVILVPLILLIPAPFSRPSELSQIGMLVIILVGVFSIIILVWLIVTGKMPTRTLRINRHTITLTDFTAAFGSKERQMSATGVEVQAVHLDFRRFFAFDLHRTSSAYHIEIIGNGETFLFPCNGKEEQMQIFKQIKEFLTS
jgi:hypothetical protein